MKNKKLPYLFLTIALLLPVSVYASENGLKTETLPQIISWEDGHAYLENGELLRDGWGYDTVNPAGKYVLADENGTVRKRLESMETDAWENYTGTELSPGIIALRTTVFEGFSGSIEVTIEEQNGVTQNMTLTQNNFYEWNLSINSGSYQIRSAVAIDKNKVYVTKFSSGFQTLPEEGLIIMHLEVMNEIARTLEEESTEAALLWKGRKIFTMLNGMFGSHDGVVLLLVTIMLCGLISMDIMTAPSISLEGKSLWIAQSLPVTSWQVLRAKLDMQLILNSIPVMLCMICTAVVCPFKIGQFVMMILQVLSFVFVMAGFGLFMGVIKPVLTWTNELTPIKQSASVMITMFGGFGYTALLFIGYMMLPGYTLGYMLYISIFIVVNVVAGLTLYIWLKTKGCDRFAEL